MALKVGAAGGAVQLASAGAVTVKTGCAASMVKLRVSVLTLPQVSRASTTTTWSPSAVIGSPER